MTARGLACVSPERRLQISRIGIAAAIASANKLRRGRFLAKVEMLPDVPGCWLWAGALSTSGYGRFGDEYAHRYSYQIHRGSIPKGLVLDHLCRTPSCVNPSHLEVVTDRVNILRGNGYSARNARRTHCPKGHPLDGITRRYGGVQSRQRYCLRCNRERAAGRKGDSR